MRNPVVSKKNAVLAAIAAAMSATAGCGSHTTQPEVKSTYAYVAMASNNYGEGFIAQYRMSGSGSLKPLSPATVDSGGGYTFFGGIPLAVDSSNHYMFFAGGGVSQFVISQDGTVTPNSVSYVTGAPDGATSIALAASGLAVVTNSSRLLQSGIDGHVGFARRLAGH